MSLTPTEQRDVEQALACADRMNDFIVSSSIKVPARIQFIAHIIAALGLARANSIDFRVINSTVRKMYAEMNRTAREMRAKPKAKLKLISNSIESAIDDDQEKNP